MTTALTGLEPPPLSLADRAYLALRDRLITLQIRPGEPIDDGQIARELEVGRTPVREALKRLEDDRLVIAYPRRGTFATSETSPTWPISMRSGCSWNLWPPVARPSEPPRSSAPSCGS